MAPDTRTLEIDGFTVIVTFPDDDSPDLSYLGVYRSRSDPEFSVPAYDLAREALCESMEEVDEAIADKPDNEWGRHESTYRWICMGDGDPAYLREDAQRLESYGNEWSCVGVKAKAKLHGVTLGRSDGIWGIETDSDPTYFDELAKEAAAEAVEQAKAKLQELRS